MQKIKYSDKPLYCQNLLKTMRYSFLAQHIPNRVNYSLSFSGETTKSSLQLSIYAHAAPVYCNCTVCLTMLSESCLIIRKHQSKYTTCSFHQTSPALCQLQHHSSSRVKLKICAPALCNALMQLIGFPLSLEEVLVGSASVTGHRAPTGTQHQSASSPFT